MRERFSRPSGPHNLPLAARIRRDRSSAASSVVIATASHLRRARGLRPYLAWASQGYSQVPLCHTLLQITLLPLHPSSPDSLQQTLRRLFQVPALRPFPSLPGPPSSIGESQQNKTTDLPLLAALAALINAGPVCEWGPSGCKTTAAPGTSTRCAKTTSSGRPSFAEALFSPPHRAVCAWFA